MAQDLFLVNSVWREIKGSFLDMKFMNARSVKKMKPGKCEHLRKG